MNKLLIDSSLTKTDLCSLGEQYSTDKSPYNSLNKPDAHRHPYTAVYDLMFAHLRYKKLNIGEIGILDNSSINCWRKYFPNATIYGWDISDELLIKGMRDNLPNVIYGFMDIWSTQSMQNGFKKSPEKFDIIIDDSTHQPEDQVRIIIEAIPFLNEGGILIIEDIFKSVDENYFNNALANYKQYFNNITFVDAEHKNRNSSGWDNDKLLIMIRNDK
jgi:hypothetical protein